MFLEHNHSPHFFVANNESIQQAINQASDGDSILIFPQVSTEDLIINKAINLIGLGSKFTTLTGSITPTVDNISFTNLGMGNATSVSVIADSIYKMEMSGCRVVCQTWNLPIAAIQFENCAFMPKSADGWVFSGSDTLAHFFNCRFSELYPKVTAGYGINIQDGAVVHMLSCRMNMDSSLTGAYGVKLTGAGADNAKFYFQNSRMVADSTFAIWAEDQTAVVIEGSHVESSNSVPANTIRIKDASSIRCFSSTIQSQSSGTDKAMKITTTGGGQAIVEFFNNYILGNVELDDPDTGDAAPVKWYGVNTIRSHGGTPLTDTNESSVGRPFTHMNWGRKAYTGNEADLAVTVNDLATTASKRAVLMAMNEPTIATGFEDAITIEPNHPTDDEIEIHRTADASNINRLPVSHVEFWEV